MIDMARPRFPEIKKRPDGSMGCRGCGGEIPPHRQTWCSHDCHLKYDPFYVKQAVRKRSMEKCEMDGCGVSLSRAAQQRHYAIRPHPPTYNECGLPWPYDHQKLQASEQYKEYQNLYSEWRRLLPEGEYDHIVPHSVGGDFVVENIRLLCRQCHLKRTAEWRKQKAEERRKAKDVTFVSDFFNPPTP